MGEQHTMANLVRELRSLTGQAQRKFTARIGVTSPTINRWEYNRTVLFKLTRRQFKVFCIRIAEQDKLKFDNKDNHS